MTVKNLTFWKTNRVFLTVFLGLIFSSSIAFSQTKTTILNNGPDANRINIILFSEGYRSAELGQFLIDANNTVNNLLNARPYSEYRNFFNAYAISVASAQSGSDHPSQSLFVNTYFDSSFDATGNYISLITIPSSGQDRINSLLQTFAPKHDLVIVVVNDQQNGGSAHSTGSTIITSKGAYAPEIVVHESGHSLAGLGDEYSTPNPGYPAIEEPNTTQQTSRNLIKWKAWIDPNTPIPTPASMVSVVGLFEGAHYQTKGWYRSQARCLMHDLNDLSFCEVCKEALVKSFYQKIRPIISFSPNANTVSISDSQAVSFNISLLQPSSHELNIQWLVNDVPSGVGSSFYIGQNSLPKGAYTIKAQVSDNTSMVRTDPSKLLRPSVSWKLYVCDNTIVWENTNGQIAEWFMNGTAFLGSTLLRNGQAVGKDWRIVGLHDFNYDGQKDFLWEHTNGNLAIWFMDGINLTGTVSLPSASREWRIVGLGDFNQDGQTDFVWQHTNGLLAVWYMNGTNRIGSDFLNHGIPVSPTWRIVGVKDFSNDSQPDLLWQNTAGLLAVWYMDRLNPTSSAPLNNGQSVGPDWRIVALKDLDNNGQIDFLWQHSAGYLAAWLMNSNSFQSIPLFGGKSVGTDWRVMGVK